MYLAIKNVIVFFNILFVLLGCSTVKAGEQKSLPIVPSWVNGNVPEKWNKHLFLTGIGSGKSLEEASAAAKKAIASSLKSRVQSQFEKNSKSDSTLDTSGKNQGTDSNSVNINTQISVDTELKFVDISETYQDKTDGMYYVFASINKLSVRNLISQKATSLKSKIKSKFEEFKIKPTYSDGKDLIQLLDQYEELNTEYSLYADGNNLLTALSSDDVTKIQSELKKLKAVRVISINLTSSASGFKEELVKCLEKKNLKVSSLASDASQKFVFQGELVSEEKNINITDWLKYEFRLSANLSQNGKDLGSISELKTVTCKTLQACVEKIRPDFVEKACEQTIKLVNE